MSLDRNKKNKTIPKIPNKTDTTPKEFKSLLHNGITYSITINPKEQYYNSSSL